MIINPAVVQRQLTLYDASTRASLRDHWAARERRLAGRTERSTEAAPTDTPPSIDSDQ